MSNTDYAPEVIQGAKRLHRAFYKRKRGPWEGVIVPWDKLTDSQRQEFLRVAAVFHAAEYVHAGIVDRVVDEAAMELDKYRPATYPYFKWRAYIADRYDEYTNRYLDT